MGNSRYIAIEGPIGVGKTSLAAAVAATLGPGHGFSATAQAAWGFRDPTLSDRYFRGPTGRGPPPTR